MDRYLYLGLISLLVFAGCADDSGRPVDLPPLFPATITVTQGGVPLEDALVEMTLPDPPLYRPTATTDANGVAVMRTYGFPGAPAGNYKITVRKGVTENIVYGTDDFGRQIVLSSDNFLVVQPRYSDVGETPHEIEVPANRRGVQVTIDVGEPARIRTTR